MLNEIFKKSNEIYRMRRDLKRAINQKLSEMDLYGYSRVIVDTEYVEIRFQTKIKDTEIKILEYEFDMKLTYYESKCISNINEPRDVFCSPNGECKFFIYRFRGDNYGN